MSRRQQSTLEDLLDLSARLPWRLALIPAAVSYLVFHALSELPVSAPSNLDGLSGTITNSYVRAFAGILQYIAPLVLSFGAMLSFVTARRNRRLLAEAKLTAGAADLQTLSWRDFEHLVGQAFRERGFAVTETDAGPDGGIDLELRKTGELHLVQCKRWRARKVGVETVRELYGVMSARGAVGGYVVSSGQFSDEAKRFAAGRNIDLWDGAKLKAVIRGVQDRRVSSSPSAHNPDEPTPRTPATTVATVPVCPTCGSAMVKRVAKRGAKSGQTFWGCSRYPDCRSTRPIPVTK